MAATFSPYRTDGKPTWLTVKQALAMLAERGKACSPTYLYDRAKDGSIRATRVGATRSLRVLSADVEKLLPEPPAADPVPEPPAVDRVLALLGELSGDELRRVAIRALELQAARGGGR